MTKYFGAAMILGFLACGPALAQDLYRCDYPDGRVVYQGAQCEIGVKQTALDAENAKREQIQKTMEEERQKKRQKSEAVTTSR